MCYNCFGDKLNGCVVTNRYSLIQLIFVREMRRLANSLAVIQLLLPHYWSLSSIVTTDPSRTWARYVRVRLDPYV